MAKPGYTLIAEHFGSDSQSIKDYEYQPGRFSKPVYSLSDNTYWAGGKDKPKDYDGLLVNWEQVISSYDGASVLWKCVSSDNQ